MENYNPFDAILGEIKSLRELVETNISTPTIPTPDTNKYECGVHVAEEVTGLKRQTIYQRIKDIPHKRIHWKLYFSRAELQEYIKNEGKK